MPDANVPPLAAETVDHTAGPNANVLATNTRNARRAYTGTVAATRVRPDPTVAAGTV